MRSVRCGLPVRRHLAAITGGEEIDVCATDGNCRWPSSSDRGRAQPVGAHTQGGTDLPTFCYSELSVYGACRMCVVEIEAGSYRILHRRTPAGHGGKDEYGEAPRDKKTIIELLLANHDRDCTTCSKNGGCKLRIWQDGSDARQVRQSDDASSGRIDAGDCTRPEQVHSLRRLRARLQ